MSETHSEVLDPSILSIDLDMDAKEGFWHAVRMDADMACGVRRLIHAEVLDDICRDHLIFSNYILDKHHEAPSLSDAPKNYDIPTEVDDYLCECTPQFILRNIPKIERYYDLERSLPFEIEDMPIVDAKAMIEEGRHAHLGEIQFIESENIKFINDFRVFLEEVFVLCPWGQITRTPPGEDSPWHLKNSVTQLARDLLGRKNTLFVFGTKGMTQMQMKDFDPEKERKKLKESQGAQGGIGMPTFGPG